MKAIYSSNTGRGRQPRRRIGEVKQTTVQDLSTFTKHERVKLKIAAAMSALNYGRYES